MPPPADAHSQPAPHPVDRRQHRRVPVALLGRYMLPNRQEYPCQTINISPGGIVMIAPVRGLIGERIVLCVEHLGRIEGQIVRHTDLGLALAVGATIRKRDKLASQLTWLANRQSLGLPEERRHGRLVPRHTAVSVTIGEKVRTVTGRIIDVSLSGAAVALIERPALGSMVTLGKTPGRVTRHFEGGICVEFIPPLSHDGLDEDVIL